MGDSKRGAGTEKARTLGFGESPFSISIDFGIAEYRCGNWKFPIWSLAGEPYGVKLDLRSGRPVEGVLSQGLSGLYVLGGCERNSCVPSLPTAKENELLWLEVSGKGFDWMSADSYAVVTMFGTFNLSVPNGLWGGGLTEKENRLLEKLGTLKFGGAGEVSRVRCEGMP
jgi:hypothetical protein